MAMETLPASYLQAGAGEFNTSQRTTHWLHAFTRRAHYALHYIPAPPRPKPESAITGVAVVCFMPTIKRHARPSHAQRVMMITWFTAHSAWLTIRNMRAGSSLTCGPRLRQDRVRTRTDEGAEGVKIDPGVTKKEKKR